MIVLNPSFLCVLVSNFSEFEFTFDFYFLFHQTSSALICPHDPVMFLQFINLSKPRTSKNYSESIIFGWLLRAQKALGTKLQRRIVLVIHKDNSRMLLWKLPPAKTWRTTAVHTILSVSLLESAFCCSVLDPAGFYS